MGEIQGTRTHRWNTVSNSLQTKSKMKNTKMITPFGSMSQGTNITVTLKMMSSFSVCFPRHANTLLWETARETNKHPHPPPHTQTHAVTHILVAHVPVRPLSVWHHLPGDDPITPDIWSWCKLPVGNRLRCRPAHRDFTALKGTKWAETSTEDKWQKYRSGKWSTL